MNAEITSRLVEIALANGANEAEAYLRISRNLTVEVKDRKIDAIESSVTSGYCIRIIKDHRLGFSYSTNIRDIDSTVKKAIEASRYAEPDEYLGLPCALSQSKEVKVYDTEVISLSEDDAINYALLIEDSAYKEDKRVKKIRKASANFSTSEVFIINSCGININYQTTSCSAQTMVIAEENGESQMGWDYQASRFLNELSFIQVGKTAARRATQLLGAKKIVPTRGFVLLDNSIVSEFLGILSISLSADSVQKKKSIFANKKGELVLSDKLDIVDSGLLDKRLGSKPFDDEGVPTTSKKLIESGVLKNFLHNTYTARKEGLFSTGNAVRAGFTGLPAVGITNLVLEASSGEYVKNFEWLKNSINTGLYVTETMGMHTVNPISGEFSVGASGLWVENGEMRHPVKEAIISGSITDLFKNVSMIGDDIRFYGNIAAPSLLIENIDISA